MLAIKECKFISVLYVKGMLYQLKNVVKFYVPICSILQAPSHNYILLHMANWLIYWWFNFCKLQFAKVMFNNA